MCDVEFPLLVRCANVLLMPMNATGRMVVLCLLAILLQIVAGRVGVPQWVISHVRVSVKGLRVRVVATE
jgi:hypothetical protein